MRWSPDSTTVGPRTRIFPFASIGHQPQDLKYAGRAVDARDRRRLHHPRRRHHEPGHERAAGMQTLVGDDCLFMANAHVGA